mgnify:FL=1
MKQPDNQESAYTDKQSRQVIFVQEFHGGGVVLVRTDGNFFLDALVERDEGLC